MKSFVLLQINIVVGWTMAAVNTREERKMMHWGYALATRQYHCLKNLTEITQLNFGICKIRWDGNQKAIGNNSFLSLVKKLQLC